MTPLLTKEEIEALLKEATPGPWHCQNNVGVVFASDCHVCKCGDFSDKELIPFNAERWRCDPGYIGHSDKIEAALRDALRRAEEAEVKNARLHSQLIELDQFASSSAGAEVRLEEAEARIAELTAALEPFGRVAAAIPPSVGNSTRVVVGCSTHKPKVGDFRRAAALQQQPDEEQGNGG